MPPACPLPTIIIRQNSAENTIVPIPSALTPSFPGGKSGAKQPVSVQMEAQTTVPVPWFPGRNPGAGGLRPRNRENYSLLSEFICHNNSISAQKSQASPAVRLFRLVGNRRFRGRFFPFIQSFVFPSSRRPRKLLFFRDLKSIRKVIFIYPISWFFAFINRYFLDFSCVKTTLYELSVYM